MSRKEVICRQRVRRIPPQFSWIDHRLVRDEHVCGRSAEALALYLFLVTVGDARGLSWYSEISLSQWLTLGVEQIREARRELMNAELIAYRKPVYQVLNLSPSPIAVSCKARTTGDEPVAIADVMRGIMRGGGE
jgi:hypothetical protein